MAGILFIISAPSGSGKSTLVSELRKQVSGVDFAISWTTRSPRGSEENGREYNFTTREEFERMIDEGVFLEYAEVFGHFYGTALGCTRREAWLRDGPPPIRLGLFVPNDLDQGICRSWSKARLKCGFKAKHQPVSLAHPPCSPVSHLTSHGLAIVQR